MTNKFQAFETAIASAYELAYLRTYSEGKKLLGRTALGHSTALLNINFQMSAVIYFARAHASTAFSSHFLKSLDHPLN
jgi:hypothetical protein